MRGNRYYHEHDYHQALSHYQKALEQENQVTTGGNEMILWNIHNRLCATYTKLKDWEHVHTEADAALKGSGAAQAVVEKTLEYIEANNQLLLPFCPYVFAYIQKHPEWKRIVDKRFKAYDEL